MSALEAENVKTRKPLDNTLARQVLHWTPDWTLEEGIGQYAQAFREYNDMTQ